MSPRTPRTPLAMCAKHAPFELQPAVVPCRLLQPPAATRSVWHSKVNFSARQKFSSKKSAALLLLRLPILTAADERKSAAPTLVCTKALHSNPVTKFDLVEVCLPNTMLSALIWALLMRAWPSFKTIESTCLSMAAADAPPLLVLPSLNLRS